MEPRFQTSFIPKKPMVADPRLDRSRTINIFVTIASFAFVASILFAGAAFGYKTILSRNIAENKITLERAKAAFDPALIEKIIRLDNRINSASTLLSDHVMVSNFFSLLETATLKTIRFTSFTFSFLGKDKVTVEMEGQAKSFTSVALQSDRFNEDRFFKNTIVSDLELEPVGTVSFKVITSIDPAVVAYREMFRTVPNTIEEESLPSLPQVASSTEQVIERTQTESAVASSSVQEDLASDLLLEELQNIETSLDTLPKTP